MTDNNDDISRAIRQSIASSVDTDDIVHEARGTEPFVGIEDERLIVTLPAADDETVVRGHLTPEEARKLTLALRASAASIDGEPFLAGGWHDRLCAERLHQLTDYYVDKYGTAGVDQRLAGTDRTRP